MLTLTIYYIVPLLFLNKYKAQSTGTLLTGSCLIPAYQVLSNITKHLLQHQSNTLPNCYNKITYLDSNSTHIWVLKDVVSKHYTFPQELNCCYKHFSAATIEDVTYSSCQEFDTIIRVNHDFVRVQCDYLNEIVHDDFFLFDTNKNNFVLERNSNSKAPNVLMFGFESMSRMNFLRTMKKTRQFLRSRGSLQLLAYNKLGDNSYPNLFPLVTGKSFKDVKKTCVQHDENYFDIQKCPFIWDEFRKAGFYTALAADSSAGFLGAYESKLPKIPTDFYLQPFIYETRFVFADRTYNYHTCLHNRYFYKILLNYVKSVINKVSKNKLFGIFWEQSVSHEHPTQSSAMDEHYYKLLKNLEDSSYLERTVVIFFSDHGQRFGDFASTREGYLESRLPLLEILLPMDFRRQYRSAVKHLVTNTERLTTAFDIYETLLDLLKVESKPIYPRYNESFPGITNEEIAMSSEKLKSRPGARKISLFMPMPASRTCKSLDIPEHYCVCVKGVKVPIGTELRRFVTELLITEVNHSLRIYPQCSQLELKSILYVSGVAINDHSQKFTVVIKTNPGFGILEGTVINNFGNWTVSGTIGRLNKYRYQSCIQDEVVKMYCFCPTSKPAISMYT